MKIISITFGKTINIGNYQSVRVDFTGNLDDAETVDQGLIELKSLVAFEEQRILRENPPTRK